MYDNRLYYNSTVVSVGIKKVFESRSLTALFLRWTSWRLVSPTKALCCRYSSLLLLKSSEEDSQNTPTFLKIFRRCYSTVKPTTLDLWEDKSLTESIGAGRGDRLFLGDRYGWRKTNRDSFRFDTEGLAMFCLIRNCIHRVLDSRQPLTQFDYPPP